MNLFPKQRLRDTESILTVTKEERGGIRKLGLTYAHSV